MKNPRTILVACTLAASVTACNAPAVVSPNSPNSGEGHTSTRSNYVASIDTTATTPSAADAERGGPFTVGSGN